MHFRILKRMATRGRGGGVEGRGGKGREGEGRKGEGRGRKRRGDRRTGERGRPPNENSWIRPWNGPLLVERRMNTCRVDAAEYTRPTTVSRGPWSETMLFVTGHTIHHS